MFQQSEIEGNLCFIVMGGNSVHLTEQWFILILNTKTKHSQECE